MTGHEFHRTQVEYGAGRVPAWRFRPRPSRPHGLDAAVEEGAVHGDLHASYLHVHWAGHPALAARFAAAAARYAGIAVRPASTVPNC